MTLNLENIDIPRGTEIKESRGKIYIIKERKSRIVMKDGEKIAALAQDIGAKNPGNKLIFKTNAPLCSKTRAFLEERNIFTETT